MSAALEGASTSEPRAVFPLPARKTAAALAALGGFLYFLAFPGVDVWPLAFVAQVPFILALRKQSPKHAAWLGLLNGTVMTTCGFYWLLEMLKVFGGFPLVLNLFFVLVICAYQGGRHAAIGWLAARAETRGWGFAPAYTAAFVTSELLYPLLFPWYTAAQLHKAPVFLQIADIGGPLLAGLVLVAINLAIAELVAARLEKRSPERRLLAIGAGGLVITGIYGAIRIPMIDKRAQAAESARVGIVQANMGLMQKRMNASEGVRRHHEMTAALRRDQKIDFVVWSESSVMYSFPEQAAESMLRDRVTGTLGIPALFGAVVYKPAPERHLERLFNTSFSTDERGRITARYDKQFLLMFGEYLPFGEAFPILHKWSPNSGRFSPGKTLDPLLIPVGNQTRKISMLICYEDILPAFVVSAVRHADPDLLVNITNDAWFGDTAEPWQHLALAQLRAIEHRRYLVRSTNSGVSAVVDPVGRVIAKSGTFKPEALASEIRWLRSNTVYSVIGNVPFYFVAIASLFMAYRRHKRETSEG
jgi:apolipoprotein N-acyltransferase